MKTIEQLKARLAELNVTAKAIQTRADEANRELTVEESTELDAVVAEFDQLEADIKRREKIDAQAGRLEKPQGRRVEPTQIENRARDGLQNTSLRTQEERMRFGFQNFGEFARAVRQAAMVGPQAMDTRLLANAAASTISTESIGADGGFAVPPEWRDQITSLIMAEDSLMQRCDTSPTSKNQVTMPVDETTAHQTSGGIQAYWRGEGNPATQSKVSLKEISVKLNALSVLVPVTDELLEDAPLMSSYIPKKAGEKIDFKINDAIINGLGDGMPLGILKSPALVTAAAVGSQTADTVHAQNIVSMWSRMIAKRRGGAVWLINQDVEPQLLTLGMPVVPANSTTPVGGMPIYMPPGGLSAAPYATLLGRPVIVTEACSAIGDVGDIILADLSGYFMPYKSGGVKSDVSIHLWFDQSVTAFKFSFRVGGQPWMSAPMARKNGSNTLSTFVTLAAR